MNKFNKLYNLILESIISQNSAYRKKLIQNTTYSPGQKSWILRYLSRIGDNKTADLIARFFANHQITGFKDADDSLNRVKRIIKLNPSIDTQNFKGTLKEFLETYQPTIQKTLQRQISKTIAHLDSIPEFYGKEEPEEGIVIYRVKDTKEGMHAVRKVVDDQWGLASNPWCLIARKYEDDWDLEEAWKFWSRYDKFPKQIAFQNGQLIAFRASQNEYVDSWWNRQDEQSTSLELKDGEWLDVDFPEWSSEELKLKEGKVAERFINKHQLKYNESTGRYDQEYDFPIDIYDHDLVDGHLPVPLGVVNGSVMFDGCDRLTSLQNSPTYVGGNFALYGCYNLKSLKGCPKQIKEQMTLNTCNGLTSLKDGPEKVGHRIYVFKCWRLTWTEEEKEKYNLKVDNR